MPQHIEIESESQHRTHHPEIEDRTQYAAVDHDRPGLALQKPAQQEQRHCHHQATDRNAESVQAGIQALDPDSTSRVTDDGKEDAGDAQQGLATRLQTHIEDQPESCQRHQQRQHPRGCQTLLAQP